MSQPIWMVGGTTGEYSDRTEWVVDAWRTEAEAQERAVFLKRRIEELGIATVERYGKKYEKAIADMKKEDVAFQNDYTGTEYYVCELELKP